MRIPRQSKLLIEPPSVATGDIAFNLLVFFLICASSSVTAKGRKQELPRAEKEKKQETPQKNVEVALTRTTIEIGDEGAGLARTSLENLAGQLRQRLAGKTRPEERVVVVRSSKDTPYERWIKVTGIIEREGGTITLQLQEEKEVVVP